MTKQTSLWLSLWLVLLLFPILAIAHPVSTTAVFIDVRDTGVELEVQLPVDQLRLALPKQTIPESGDVEPATRALFVDYLGEFIRVAPPQGQPLVLSVGEIEFAKVDDRPHLSAVMSFDSEGEVFERAALQLHFNAILHRVITHKAYVYLRNDFRTGRFASEPVQLGIVHYQNKTLDLSLEGGSHWQGVKAMFLHGMHHIAEGADHLLFLLCLLLPAPLIAKGRRWVGDASLRDSLWSITKIVTAFTLGHSLTLALVSLDILHVSSRWVEVFVAVSILVAAVHALVPVLGKRLLLVALVFGLVHGMAFAGTLVELGLESGITLLLGLLGFNLGIEFMQLLIVAAVIPCIIVLNRNRWYTPVRLGLAAVAIAAAMVWIYERLAEQETFVGEFITVAWSFSLWAYIALVLFAAVSQWSSQKGIPASQ